MKHKQALIVDDEYTAREILKDMVNWELMGFDLPMLAGNGAEALHMIGTNDFDIVFTDVEMPIMNGIELIEKVRKIKPNQRFVIISCHEKFEYAQRALRMGVEDYIIKDLLIPNELRSLLAAASAQKSEQPEKKQLTLGKVLMNAAQGMEQDLDILPANTCMVLSVVADDYDRLIFDFGETEASERISALAEHIPCSAVWNTNEGMLYVLCQAPEVASTLYYINDAVIRANNIRNIARKYRIGRITIGISNPFGSICKLHTACREAVEAAEVRITEGLNKTILYNSISLKRQMIDSRYIDNLLERVDDLAFNANMNCLNYIDKLYSVELTSGFADANYYRYINNRLCTMLIAMAKENAFSKREILDDLGLKPEEIDRLENSKVMAQFYKTAFVRIISASTMENRENVVTSAIDAIEHNYTSDISLNSLAEQIHTNKSYLCRAFKSQVGVTIMHYIENKRIDRAKYLLANTQMQLWEISNNLGFSSQQYFSFVFKKSTGLSPTDFRKMQEKPE